MPPKVAPASTYKYPPPKANSFSGKKTSSVKKLPLTEARQASLFKRPAPLGPVKQAWQEQPAKKSALTSSSRISHEKEKAADKILDDIKSPAPSSQHYIFTRSKLPNITTSLVKPTAPSSQTVFKSSTIKNEPHQASSAAAYISKQPLPPIHRTPAFENIVSVSAKTPSFPQLDPLELTSSTGKVRFENLVKIIQTEHNYWIPSVWPKPINQRGHCCGLYALEIALKYANPDRAVPPARKNGDHSIQSLREIAKKLGYSSFGEIYNVAYLKETAAVFGFTGCQALQTKAVPYSLYIKKLCSLLQAGNSLIVSCDLGGTNDSPNQSGGRRAHWALVFGFFYSNNECNLLVTQYGKYYLWSAKNLYDSNFQLPSTNPRCSPFYFYYKDQQTKEEFYLKTDKNTNLQSLKTARHCKETHLLNFQFSLLATPTLALSKTIRLEAQSTNTQTAENPNSAQQSIGTQTRSRFK